MGYHTEFFGDFYAINPPLNPSQVEYLTAFAETRRMKRDSAKASALTDTVRAAVNLPIGQEGGFFVGGEGFNSMGSASDTSVLDINRPPKGQPGLWCQWIPEQDGSHLTWDGGEKFYEYQEWLTYLIENFFKPWGCTLNGSCEWQGEERQDVGCLGVINNVVSTYNSKHEYDAAVVQQQQKALNAAIQDQLDDPNTALSKSIHKI